MSNTNAAGGRAESDRKGATDLIYAIIGTAIQVGSGALMLPFLATTLEAAELTLWYVFLTFFTISLLLEFGLSPTIGRNFAYVLHGARALSADGMPQHVGDRVDPVLLSSLLSAAKKIYGVVAAAVAVLVGGLGTVYLIGLLKTSPAIEDVWPAWAIFASALVVQMALSWQGCVLIGAGRMRQHYEVMILARITQLVLSVAGLFFVAPSLLVLAAAYAVSVAVARIHTGLLIRDIERTARTGSADRHSLRSVLAALLPSASKLGLCHLGDFLTERSMLLVVSLSLGAVAASSYAIALQLVVILMNLSHVVATLTGTRLAAARMAGDWGTARDLYAFAVVFGLVVSICGVAALMLLGNPILQLLGATVTLPPAPILAIMGVTAISLVQLHIANSFIMSGNRLPFVRSVLLTGAGTAALGAIAATLSGDLLPIVASALIVPWIYNNWRWPMVAFSEARLPVRDLGRAALRGALGTVNR